MEKIADNLAVEFVAFVALFDTGAFEMVLKGDSACENTGARLGLAAGVTDGR